MLPIFILAGCQGVFGPQGLPKDPLFVNQRPIEGKAKSAAPVGIAAVDPAPPLAPLEITSRPAFAQRKAPELPDQVQLTGGRVDAVNPLAPARPPRSAPGLLPIPPLPRDVTLPELKRP